MADYLDRLVVDFCCASASPARVTRGFGVDGVALAASTTDLTVGPVDFDDAGSRSSGERATEVCTVGACAFDVKGVYHLMEAQIGVLQRAFDIGCAVSIIQSPRTFAIVSTTHIPRFYPQLIPAADLAITTPLGESHLHYNNSET